MSVGERLCSRVSDRPAPPLAAFGRQGQIIAHFLGRSYDLHIYYGIFCTGCLVVSCGPWSSPTTSPVHLLFLPHLQIWKGIGGHTSAVSGMRLLNLVWVLHCAKAFTAVFTSGWSILLSLLSTDSPSQVRAAPSSCEALSLCPVLSCALLLACTMQAPSLCGG